MNSDRLRTHPSAESIGLSREQARATFARMNAMATRFYCDRLPGSWVPGYLRARGFGPEVQQRWHIGYAPAAWDALTRHLRARGCPDVLIEAAGLARRTQSGRLRDLFRDRVMLPIRSPSGTVLGFIGRAVPGAQPQVPKYLNSPRNCLYDKSATLFGLWEGRQALAHGAQPVLVEGPFDAIAVATADQLRHVGLTPCGTALTSRHSDALRRHTDMAAAGLTVAFDGDEAGRRAAARAYHLLSPSTEKLTATAFREGSDPAQVLAESGAVALATLLRTGPRPLADVVVDEDIRRWARWLDHPEGQINALRSAARLIATMPTSQVGRQVARLAERLSLDYALVTDAVTSAVLTSR